jgi:AcrR family transcriptional regulator
MVSRAEHRRTTLLAISAATTLAYEELGPAATFDDIAERAGLSRRTLFRYVDSKEELLFIHPMMWLDIFDEAVAEVASEPLRHRISYASRRISEHIDSDPSTVRRAMAAALTDPSAMARGNAAANQRWIQRVTTEIRGDAVDPETAFKASVLGSAIMGVIDAALGQWFGSDETTSLADLVEQGLDYLAPILDAD